MKSLIAGGADVNARSHNGSMVLIDVVSNPALLPCIKLLLESGADVNIAQSCYKGTTALAEAARSIVPEEAGAQAAHSTTPAPVVQSTTLMQRLYSTYLERASSSTNEGTVTMGHYTECAVALLLKAGAHVNKKAKGHPNALQAYVSQCYIANEAIVMLLLAAGEITKGMLPVTLRPDGRATEDPVFLEIGDDSLKHLTREGIRKHLIRLDQHTNLFHRIPQLGDSLPKVLTRYLLYGMELTM